MNQLSLSSESGALDLRAQDIKPLQGWSALALFVFSLLMLAGIVHALRGFDFDQILGMLPSSPLFWIVFAAYYLGAPASEWIIYRRLWAVPGSCMSALLRKLVCNELLLGYLGEVYLYTWARKRVAMAATPFGAIKDVAVLSAIAGNGVTLASLVLIWPLVGTTQLGLESRPVMLSLAVVLATSIVVMLFRGRIFTLQRSDLWFIFGVHLVRIGVLTALTALLWHLVLPDVPVLWWMFLSTLRMLISRLPLVPNKDVVFAGLAVFTLGHETQIAALMTMMASLILLTHVMMGGGLVIADLLRKGVNE